MRPWKPLLSIPACVSAIVMACGSQVGGVGAPCETKADCEGELVCDEHEGQASCQEPHGHGESDAESAAHGTDATESHHGPSTGSESSSDPDDTGAASTSSTGGADSESATAPATDTGTTGGGASLECQSYCTCLTAECSEYDAYPHADEQACLDACAALAPDSLTCFAGFCEDAAVERSENLEEHWCEHAWGELGTDKC
jgi:hypothetical protein